MNILKKLPKKPKEIDLTVKPKKKVKEAKKELVQTTKGSCAG